MSVLKLKPALALLAATPTLIGATGLATNFEDRVLAAQNRERSSAGVAPLRWSSALARSAQGWADHLARTGAFEHAPDRPVDPEGENIWGGTRGYYAVEAMVDAWVREKRDFRPGIFPNNSATGDVEDVGHYTQLMWRNSSEVGCALARSPREDLLVCRYSQAGNYIGQQPF